MAHWVRLILFCSLLGLHLQAQDAPGPEPLTAKDLPRVPPTEPRDALRTFKIKPGFRLELAANEPAVASPIAIAFDADNRLYVVEMRDYSERRDERLGRIRRLEDRDQDGRYETSTIFVDQLPW